MTWPSWNTPESAPRPPTIDHFVAAHLPVSLSGSMRIARSQAASASSIWPFSE
jgi:hypothetical protein